MGGYVWGAFVQQTAFVTSTKAPLRLPSRCKRHAGPGPGLKGRTSAGPAPLVAKCWRSVSHTMMTKLICMILDDFWDIATYISFGTYQQSSNISLFTTRNHYICPLEDPRSGKMLGHRDWLMFRSASGSKKKWSSEAAMRCMVMHGHNTYSNWVVEWGYT